MNRTIQLITGLVLAALAAGCGSAQTESTVMDFRNAGGAFILVYTTDSELRTMFEDRLVGDLAARDIHAVASHSDLPDIAATDRDAVLAAARSHRNMFVVVVEEVGHDQIGVVPGKGRITHDHPTLLEFYRHSKPADHQHADETQVFVEVSAFLIQDEGAKLTWSGAAWSFRADGEAGRIFELSTIIANAMDEARRSYLGPEA